MAHTCEHTTPTGGRSNEQLAALWRVLTVFEEATGALINKTKTEGLAVGALRQHQLDGHDLPQKSVIGWLDEGTHTKILGAPLGNGFDENDYWQKIYIKFTERISSWRHRTPGVVPEARVSLLYSMCLSLFFYQCQTRCPSQELGTKLRRDIEYFIFKKKPNFNSDADDGEKSYRKWLAKETMHSKKQHGGLGVPNWDAQVGALQAMWVVRYIGPANQPWRPLLDYYLLHRSGPRGRLESFSTVPLATLLARLTPMDLPNPSNPSKPITNLKARKAASHPILKFWRAALVQFRHLKWAEETDRTGSHVLAESIFDSPTCSPPPNVVNVRYWKQACGLHSFRDLINPETGAFYTPLELHQSITGSSRTRRPFPKFYKGMDAATAAAEYKAIIDHADQRTASEAKPYLTSNPAWSPEPDEIVGWTSISPNPALAASSSARDTNRQLETEHYGKVISFDAATLSVQLLPQTIGVHGTPVTITPKDTPTNPLSIDDMTRDELPITIHLSELRQVLTFKGKIWGIAEHTDVHPTETHLPAIPGVCPAVPLAKVAVRDIARRLSHRTAATPRAQKTWPEKLGYCTAATAYSSTGTSCTRTPSTRSRSRATATSSTSSSTARRAPCTPAASASTKGHAPSATTPTTT